MKHVGKSFEDVQAKTDPVFEAFLTQRREVEKSTSSAARPPAMPILSHALMTAIKVIGDSLEQWKSVPNKSTHPPGWLIRFT
jgi:hypothetical protein